MGAQTENQDEEYFPILSARWFIVRIRQTVSGELLSSICQTLFDKLHDWQTWRSAATSTPAE